MDHKQRRFVCNEHGLQREAVWGLDLEVIAATQSWARDRARVERELEAMAKMYPTWTLTISPNAQPPVRPGAVDVVVPTGGAWRWASDGTPANISGTLMWDGLLPAPLAGLDQALAKLKRKYPVEIIKERPWTSVPVRVVYPPDFPRSEPMVFYDERWLRDLNIFSGGTFHMLGGGRLCLFYPGHWKRGYTVADVLSQRVINHLYSILKIANGTNPIEAFIGRIHDTAWRPSA